MRLRFSILSLLAIPALFMSMGISSALAIDSSSISVNINPSSPAPYENTIITLSTFSANLDNVLISWFVDGKSTLSGIGKKSLSVTAKAANVETKVLVRIFLPDGEINKNITIRPAVMVLLWQANDSYFPPFFKGKAMPTDGSEIKVVGMPEIKVGSILVNPKNMTYVWKNGDNNMPKESGYCKNFLAYVNDYLENSESISVTVSTVDQKYSSQSNITIRTVRPEIFFYRQDAELGIIWENALSANHQIKSEEIILAAPYFISPKDIRRPELIFNWSINDRTVNIPIYSKSLMQLKAQAGASGASKLRLDIENTGKIYQSAKKEINIAY